MVNRALITITPDVLSQVVKSTDVRALDSLAHEAADAGAKLAAISYLAAHRIYAVFSKVEESRDDVLRRAMRIWAPELRPPDGATGLRRLYCEHFFGWSSYNAWAEDWCSSAPISRSSAWMKVHDIQSWREQGCSWQTIMGLLSNTPMAGREALEKPIQPEALPPGGMPQYLEELAALPPGQARKKVSEDAGEPQMYVSGAKWVSGVLLLNIVLESNSGVENYDLIVYKTSTHTQDSWMGVAHWLSEKLGHKMLVG